MKPAFDYEQLTAENLSAALGYEVRIVASTKVGTGQTGASYRLVLDSGQGPRSILAKVAAGDLNARARVKAGYAAEVGFYDQLVSRVNVRTPQCWYAAISGDQLHFTLLLEDLAPRVPGVQVEACSVERAMAAIRNLAGLHAPLWNDSSLFEQRFLINMRDASAAEFLGKLTQDSAATFVERFGDTLSEVDRATIRDAAAAIATWIMLPQNQFSVLHGDYRLDNLMFGEAPDDVVVLDWQTASVGPPTRDLAYFIGTCLEVEQRRAAEDELVECYHREILARGIKDYSLEQCFRDYCLGLLQATLITTIGLANATGEQTAESDAMFLAMATRSSAAIRDLKTLELLA